MPGTAQLVATVPVFDYLYDTQGKALSNAEVVIQLEFNRATAIAPVVSLPSTPIRVTTDPTGYWTAGLVPNSNINPANTVYTVRAGGQSFQISVPAGPGPYQASAIATTTPPAMVPAGPFTAGSVLFAGPNGAATQDNGLLSWDDTNKKAVIGGDIAARSLTASNSPYSTPSGTIPGSDNAIVLDNGGMCVNVKHNKWGATGDGVRDDGTLSIQPAIDSLGTGGLLFQGGMVVLPGSAAAYGTTAQVVVRPRVQLVGTGRDVSMLKALATFPINTAVVRLGDTTSGVCQGTRIENMTVETSGIAGSTGVYSERINENSGIFRVTVYDAQAFGVQIKQPVSGGGAQNYVISGLEVLWPNNQPQAGTVGLAVTNTSAILPARYIQDVTVVANVGHALTTAIQVDGCPCRISDIHVEQATNGLLVGSVLTCAGAGIMNVTCVGSTVANLVVLSSGTNQNGIDVSGVTATGAATNILVDQLNGITINDFSLDGSYRTGDGGPNTQTILVTKQSVAQRFNRVLMLKDLRRSTQTVALNGGTVTIDATAGELVNATLSASTTIAISNAAQGQVLVLRIQHDNTANVYALTWPGTVKRAGGAFANTNAANAQDNLTLMNDGTNWEEQGRALNVS